MNSDTWETIVGVRQTMLNPTIPNGAQSASTEVIKTWRQQRWTESDWWNLKVADCHNHIPTRGIVTIDNFCLTTSYQPIINHHLTITKHHWPLVNHHQHSSINSPSSIHHHQFTTIANHHQFTNTINSPPLNSMNVSINPHPRPSFQAQHRHGT